MPLKLSWKSKRLVKIQLQLRLRLAKSALFKKQVEMKPT